MDTFHGYSITEHMVWIGFSFERVCFAHVPQILAAIGVDRIHTEFYSWRSKESKHPAQIDLIIERADQIINVCEIKYSKGEYLLDKEEFLKIQNRINDFQTETSTRYSIHATLITTYGLRQNSYSSIATNQIILDDLFCDK